MTFYIGVEDVVANGLIEVPEASGSQTFISYRSIQRYGDKVVKSLSKNPKQKAVFVMSRDATNVVFRDYSDFFVEAVVDNQEGIRLKEGKNKNDLVNRFRGCLAFQVLCAFVDKENTKVLWG